VCSFSSTGPEPNVDRKSGTILAKSLVLLSFDAFLMLRFRRCKGRKRGRSNARVMTCLVARQLSDPWPNMTQADRAKEYFERWYRFMRLSVAFQRVAQQPSWRAVKVKYGEHVEADRLIKGCWETCVACGSFVVQYCLKSALSFRPSCSSHIVHGVQAPLHFVHRCVACTMNRCMRHMASLLAMRRSVCTCSMRLCAFRTCLQPVHSYRR
jgi:hypothetical protein